MKNETLFFIIGIALAVSAVVISFVGLKAEKFPGKAFVLVVVWFFVFAVGAGTFSVLHAQDEKHHKEAEFEEAGHEIEEIEDQVPEGQIEAEDQAKEEPSKGGGEASGGSAETLKLAADESALAYDTDSLESGAGAVTIDFENPSAIPHDVAIEQDGEELAATELITDSEDSVSTELKAGDYTFYCTVPGHREAGMEGTLSVK